MKSFIPCRTCVTRDGPQPGYYYVQKDAVQYVKECQCHIGWRKQKDLERRCLESNVWPDLQDSSSYKGDLSIADAQAARKYFVEFPKYEHAMVYMHGPNGTQKTTTAMWGAQQLLKRDPPISVFYTLMETLVVSLLPDFAATSEQKSGQQDFQEKLLEADALIIDESFDRKTTTLYKSGYQIPFLMNFLKLRFEVRRKSILFISNTAPTSIASHGFSDGLQDFVTRNVSRSTLVFKDKYIRHVEAINPRGLFE